MKNFVRLAFALCLLMASSEVLAQSKTISGKVISEEDGAALPGVSVLIKGTAQGTVTDFNGEFKLAASSDDVLQFSFIGFNTSEVTVGAQSSISIEMSPSSEQLNDVVIVGSRGQGRTKIETVAPVDVIDINEMATSMPQMDLSQMLVATAPSFNAVRSQGGDLSSHVDPPTLRGLAPNQMLVLINGKRRHTSALLNGSQTGTSANAVDMSFIPSSAVERVEILRDGAAAQYGSDAIAGVMNIILKKNTGTLSGNLSVGAAPQWGTPTYENDYGGLTAGEKALQDEIPRDMDGETFQFDANYGIDIGDGGYLNVTGFIRQDKKAIRATVLDYARYSTYNSSYLNNERTDKNGNPIITNPELLEALATGSYNGFTADELTTNVGLMEARGISQYDVASYQGSPDISLGGMAINFGLPLGENFTLYATSDIGFKYIEGFSCYYRSPSWNSRAGAFGLYPNGFRPQMMTNQSNTAVTGGVKGTLGDFNIDLSNTYGRNSMDIRMKNTINVTFGDESPTNMYLGTHSFSQNSTNLDISKFLPDVLQGMNIGFGAEMRIENYQIERGQAETWSNSGNAGYYEASTLDEALLGPDGFPIENAGSSPILDANGDPVIVQPWAGMTVKNYSQGCQCFTGFGPDNEANEIRTVMGAYLDVELDVTKEWLVAAAVRTENYLDFGNVLTGKIATRYSILDNLAVRASASTGFRAPSLQELNYSQTFTYFVNTIPADATVYANRSTEARVLGIGSLQEETSVNYSVGIAADLFPGFSMTVDAYQITIENRIFQTDPFTADEAPVLEPLIGSGEAQFRINGGTISTKGIEIVTNYTTELGPGDLGLTLAATFRENKFEKATVPDLNVAISDSLLAAKYVRRASVAQFETGTPGTKLIGTINYKVNKFNFMLRPTYFGEVRTKQNDPSSIVDVAGEYNVLTGTPPVIGEDFADQTYSPELVFDMGLTYEVSNNISLTVTGSNIFDNLPDIIRYENRDFGLYSNYQQGSLGRRFMFRVSYAFNK